MPRRVTHLRKKGRKIPFGPLKEPMSTRYANLKTSYDRIPCRMSPSCLVGFAIVVVEDYDDARRYLDLFLRQLGAKVMVASNAFEALELIKNSRPDLVLSDIKMPGMDGFELLDEIRALGPEAGGSVPVIAMSAFFSQTERARTHYADFRACLPKPFTPDKLVETILGVL